MRVLFPFVFFSTFDTFLIIEARQNDSVWCAFIDGRRRSSEAARLEICEQSFLMLLRWQILLNRKRILEKTYLLSICLRKVIELVIYMVWC